MPYFLTAGKQGGFRHGWRERINRVWGQSRDTSRNAHSKDESLDSVPRALADPGVLATVSIASTTISSSNSVFISQGNDAHEQPLSTKERSVTTNDASQQSFTTKIDVVVDHHTNVVPSTVLDEVTNVALDLWSAAYREAVESLGNDINVAILKGDNVAQLFQQLEDLDKGANQESAFLRGVKYLRSVQVPLERFKLALDLASPLTSMEPTVATVFGIVKGVTAVAITISSADLQFAQQIGQMLKQLSYIDGCDTLGQKSDKVDIHQALVKVYQKLLEFYNAAYEILSRKGARLVLKMILENGRLPGIVVDFLKQAEWLQTLVEKATLEITLDIKTMLYDDAIAGWLRTAKMSRNNQHHVTQKRLREDKACEFLLTNPNFIHWYRATDSQQLVVLGDVGSGKTVGISKHELPQPKVCWHYCQNDGSGRPEYVYSALILALLEQLPGLKKTFYEWFKQMSTSKIEASAEFESLEEWLRTTLQTLDRSLYFVVDGLDECDEESRNSLIGSLRKLSNTTPRLKILLSSRPQEKILKELSGMARISMATDAERDRMIAEYTVDTKLRHLSQDVKALLIETLSRLAQGSAIWTKMTVDLIKVRGITALGPMRKFMEKMEQPSELSQLYATLFSRYTADEPENQRLATSALEILTVSQRPLSIMELAWATTLSTTEDEMLTVGDFAKWVDCSRLLGLIQPFVTHVDFEDVNIRQVKLVHQSVKEFILKAWPSSRPGLQSPAICTKTATGEALKGLIEQRIECLEAGILDISIKYLLLQDIGENDLFSEEMLAIEELPQDIDLFSDTLEPSGNDRHPEWEAYETDFIRYDPAERGFGELFVYSCCQWNVHFGAVSAEALLPRLDDIERLCHAGSKRLHNWITQSSRPGCTVKQRFVFDSSLHDPLSITSLYGSETMLRHMLDKADLGKSCYLPGTAMNAADQILQWGDLTRLRLLWRSKHVSHIRNWHFFQLVVRQWSSRSFDRNRQGWDIVFDLMDDVMDLMIEDHWGGEIMHIATSTGCTPVMQWLVGRAQHNEGLRNELENYM